MDLLRKISKRSRNHDDKGRQLYIATRRGWLSTVNELLESGVSPNGWVSDDKLGFTFLHVASSMGHLDIVQALVAHGADVACKSTQGKTALLLACEGNHVELCRWLLGHSKEQVNVACADGMTPLHVASSQGHLELVQCLFKNGASEAVKCKKNGYTPLLMAALNGHSEVVSFFLHHNKHSLSDLHVSKRKNNALHHAAMSGDLPTVNVIAEFVIRDKWHLENLLGRKGADRLTAAEIALKLGHTSVYNYLQRIQEKGVQKVLDTDLLNAVDKGDDNTTLNVLIRGANPNTQDMKSKDTVLLIATKKGYSAIVEHLITFKGDLEVQDSDGKTPLHIAIENENINIVKSIIKSHSWKIGSQTRDSRGKTPLLAAALKGNPNIVKLLLSTAGCLTTINSEWRTYRTPLVCALEHGHTKCARHLLAAGAALAATPDKKENFPTALDIAITEGYTEIFYDIVFNPRHLNFINRSFSSGLTPLKLATVCGHHDYVVCLLKAGAEIAVREDLQENGETVLHIAAKNGHTNILKQILAHPHSHKFVNVACGIEKKTPLALAIENGYQECINILKRVAASTEVPKAVSDGITPLPTTEVSYRKPSSLEKIILKETPFFNKDSALTFLRPEQLKDMYDSSEPSAQLGKGAFGIVYRGKMMFQSIQVAIKVQYVPSAPIDHFQKEKAVSFVKNPFLVPIIAACNYGQSLTLVYPLMQKGDLQKILDEDEGLLTSRERTKILWQIARALEFLHIDIPGVRKPIIHGDVKPNNILLDAFLNARLGDTGLAVEIPDGHSHVTASHTYVGTLAFRDPFSVEERQRRPYNDTFGFGAVSLMLLSGQKSMVYSGVKKDPLPADKIPLFKKMYEDHKTTGDINEEILDQLGYVDHCIWQEGIGPDSPGLVIAKYIGPCLKEPNSRPDMTVVATALQDACNKNGISPIYYTSEARCVQCMVHKPVQPRRAFGCLENCTGFCKFCHSMSFRNPLVCPNHGIVEPLIGNSNMHAVLIAGFESCPEKANIFRTDIASFHNVLRDPRVIGICETNISTVLSCRKADVTQALDNVQEKISTQMSSTPSCLLLYYSGHGTIYNGQYYLQVGKEVEDWLEASWLKDKLGSIKPQRLRVILDCCYSGGFQILPPLDNTTDGHHYTLWSSSMPTQTSCMSAVEGSRFTKYLVSGLWSGTQCFLETRGIEACNICIQFREYLKQEDVISVEKLQDFVSKHVYLESLLAHSLQEPYSTTIPDENLDIPLAYAYDQPLAYTVWFMINGNIEQQLIIEDPSKDVAFNRDLLFHQCEACINHVAKGLKGAHLMIAYTSRKGEKTEIYDTSDMIKHLAVRGEVLTVELRTIEAYLNSSRKISTDQLQDEDISQKLPPCVCLMSCNITLEAMTILEKDEVFQYIVYRSPEVSIQYVASKELQFGQPWEATPSSLLSTQDISPDTLDPDEVDQTWIIDLMSCTPNHFQRIAVLCKNMYENEQCKTFLERMGTFIETMCNTKCNKYLVVHITRQYVELQEVVKVGS